MKKPSYFVTLITFILGIIGIYSSAYFLGVGLLLMSGLELIDIDKYKYLRPIAVLIFIILTSLILFYQKI